MTNLKALTTLLIEEVITQSEFDRFEKRIQRAEAKAAEAQVVADLVPALEAFMAAGVLYKISDPVSYTHLRAHET